MFEVGVFDDEVRREHATEDYYQYDLGAPMMLSAELDLGNIPRSDLATVGAVADERVHETFSFGRDLNLNCCAVTGRRTRLASVLVAVCPLGRQDDVLRHV